MSGWTGLRTGSARTSSSTTSITRRSTGLQGRRRCRSRRFTEPSPDGSYSKMRARDWLVALKPLFYLRWGSATVIRGVPFSTSARSTGDPKDILAALDGVCGARSSSWETRSSASRRNSPSICEATDCVALEPGTSALHLALLAAGVDAGGRGDHVVQHVHSHRGGDLVHRAPARSSSDVLPETGNIDPEAVERAITERTRAIVPVHLYGRPAELDAILEVARRHGSR